jgi:hypothetical protein
MLTARYFIYTYSSINSRYAVESPPYLPVCECLKFEVEIADL